MTDSPKSLPVEDVQSLPTKPLPVSTTFAIVGRAVLSAAQPGITLTNVEANVYLWLLRYFCMVCATKARVSRRMIQNGVSLPGGRLSGTGNHYDSINAALYQLADMGLIKLSISPDYAQQGPRSDLIITIPHD